MSREVSTPIAMSASMKATAWWLKMGVPNVFLSREYFVDSSRALWARPTPAAATCVQGSETECKLQKQFSTQISLTVHTHTCTYPCSSPVKCRHCIEKSFTNLT